MFDGLFVYDADLRHLVGNGAGGGGGGSEWTEITPQTISDEEVLAFTIPIPLDSVVTVETRVVCVVTNNTSEGMGRKLISTWSNTAGSAALLGSLHNIYLAREPNTIGFRSEASGSDAIFTLEGSPGRTINWVIRYRTFEAA